MKTVLVVKDDWEIAELVTEQLELAGYRSAQADGPLDQRCFTERPDLVLCDVHVPPGASTEAARAIRATVAVRATPVVVMSSYYGYVATADRSQGALKPFSLHTILEIVKANIGQP